MKLTVCQVLQCLSKVFALVTQGVIIICEFAHIVILFIHAVSCYILSTNFPPFSIIRSTVSQLHSVPSSVSWSRTTLANLLSLPVTVAACPLSVQRFPAYLLAILFRSVAVILLSSCLVVRWAVSRHAQGGLSLSAGQPCAVQASFQFSCRIHCPVCDPVSISPYPCAAHSVRRWTVALEFMDNNSDPVWKFSCAVVSIEVYITVYIAYKHVLITIVVYVDKGRRGST